MPVTETTREVNEAGYERRRAEDRLPARCIGGTWMNDDVKGGRDGPGRQTIGTGLS